MNTSWISFLSFLNLDIFNKLFLLHCGLNHYYLVIYSICIILFNAVSPIYLWQATKNKPKTNKQTNKQTPTSRKSTYASDRSRLLKNIALPQLKTVNIIQYFVGTSDTLLLQQHLFVVSPDKIKNVPTQLVAPKKKIGGIMGVTDPPTVNLPLWLYTLMCKILFCSLCRQIWALLIHCPQNVIED